MTRLHRLLLAACLLAVGPTRAQDLGETLGSVGEAYARGYVAPLTDALGANLNAGLFRSARVGGRYGVSVYVGVSAFGMLLSDADQTFSGTFDDTFLIGGDLAEELIGIRPDGSSLPLRVPAQLIIRDAPTVFGGSASGSVSIDIDAATTVRFLGTTRPVAIDTTLTEMPIDGLLETTIAPLAVPQVGFGGFLGTDVLIRWLPSIDVEDLGATGLLGIGVRHSLSQYAPLIPFDLAVQVAWQEVTLDDADGLRIVDASTFAANVQVSKRLGVLTLYGGAQVEQSDVDVRYRLALEGFEDEVTEGEAVEVNFSSPGINRGRGIVGASLGLGPLLLNGDVGFGRVTVVSVGLGLGI